MITSYWFSLTEPKSNAYSTPATPAMNAAMVNAYSLTVRGLTAAAAAARSLDRTASIRWPSLPRRMKPTITHSSTQQISATQPNTGDGTLPSMPRNPALVPRSRPNSFSSGTPEPVEPPPQVVLVKPKFWIATAPASVTTASDTPRTRTAENAVITPIPTATRMPISASNGNGMWKFSAMWLTVNPDTPASASWMTEICPTYPVITTSDSAMIAPISVLISAPRKS